MATLDKSQLMAKLKQLEDDIGLLHRVLHGTDNEVVVLGGIDTPTVRHLYEDLKRREVTAAEETIRTETAAAKTEMRQTITEARTEITEAVKSDANRAEAAASKAQEFSNIGAATTDKPGLVKLGNGLVADAEDPEKINVVGGGGGSSDPATYENAGIVKPDKASMEVGDGGLLKAKPQVMYFPDGMPEGGLPTENVAPNTIAILNDGKGVATLNKIADEVAKRLTLDPIGEVRWFARDNAPEGWMVADGPELSRTTFSALFELWGTRFGEGDGSTTFNGPNMIGLFAQGADTQIGDLVEAGLPNIEGEISDNDTRISNVFNIYSGALQTTDKKSTAYSIQRMSSTASGESTLTFDASLSNEIYGNSDTVQPPSMKLLPCFKAFNSIQDADNITTQNIMQELQNLRNFMENRSTIIYPNGGSAESPANIVADKRYEVNNPYPGYFVNCVAQLLRDGVWGIPGWFGDTYGVARGFGTKSFQSLANDKIVVQTGSASIGADAHFGGGEWEGFPGSITQLPCRVIVTRLGKIPTE